MWNIKIIIRGNPLHVSELFKINKTQSSLNFVDVDITNDIKLFISPQAIRSLPTDWGEACARCIGTFFNEVIHSVKKGDTKRASFLLGRLKGPNETHLGLSKGKSQGRALGPKSIEHITRALMVSKAAKSGLIRDLEDTVLFIHGISIDTISDMVTNIIRGHLIHFTQEECIANNIPLTDGVASGPFWDPDKLAWTEIYTRLPIADDSKLLLVPKDIARLDVDYDVASYYRHFIIEDFKSKEINANSSLVHIAKSGKKKNIPDVYISALKEKYGKGTKPEVEEYTIKDPKLLDEYKASRAKTSTPLPHSVIADVTDSPKPDWDTLIHNIVSLDRGKVDAYKYETAVENFLTASLYPSLVRPKRQHRLNDGQKIIDLTFTNFAQEGFFKWLKDNYFAPKIIVEFKNYSVDIKNPEIDQISGRFSDKFGMFGIIICRKIDDREKLLARCKDVLNRKGEFIICFCLLYTSPSPRDS